MSAFFNRLLFRKGFSCSRGMLTGYLALPLRVGGLLSINTQRAAMPLLTPKRKTFQIDGKDKLQFIVDEITGYDEEPYAIASVPYVEGGGEVQAGYSTTIWARTTSYHRNEKKVKVKELRISVAVSSKPARLTAEHGVIGGGVFESDEYLEVEINVEPWCVKDIVEELRRDKRRGMRIDGYAVSHKAFSVAYFLLFPPKTAA